MNIGIIVENNQLKKWQLETLNNLIKKNNFFILNFYSKKKINYNKFLYYFFRILFRPQSEKNDYLKLKKKFKVFNFLNPFYNNRLVNFDENFYTCLKKQKINLLIRFGLGLIDTSKIKIPVISFHHGDPSKYRGRPACFYEMLNNEHCIGQIVQVLNNRVDQGKILSFSQSKIYKQSYRKTLHEAHSLSKFSLEKAIQNLKEKRFLNLKTNGTNYTIPSNFKVLKLVTKIFYNKIILILDRLFFLKKWKISIKQFKEVNSMKLNKLSRYLNKDAFNIKIDKLFNFIADPFYHKNSIFFEITNPFSQIGKLAKFENNNLRIFENKKKHFSFPSSLRIKKTNFILPEISSWSKLKIFKEKNGKLIDYKYIKFDNNKHNFIVDPIIHKKKNTFFLFGNLKSEDNILRLWYSDDNKINFKEHKSSPILISPLGSRMGGQILKISDGLYRFGQKNFDTYGNGLCVFKISKINKKKYKEIKLGEINLKNKNGPHTINFNLKKKEIIFDHYNKKFNLFAVLIKLNKFF